MKLPLSWLRDWIQVDADADAIAQALTLRGFYVESVERHGRSYPGVVVARVIEVARHPNADRLSLCRVDGGAGELRVVCGAPNVHAGMVAALATVGATLPGGVVIKKSKIRGEESQGMLCSARELEISDEHEGILDLARLFDGVAERAIGRPIDELFGPPDQVLEVEVPFNRPDGLGVVGLAREVAAALGGRWTDAARARMSRRHRAPDDFDLELEDREGCPRYLAQAVEGVSIGPSPGWLARRLESIGQRPINNVVDLTNLVLFELGQPLHAFDLDRLAGPAIRVRRARAQESIVTLDAKPRTLTPEVLVIADRDRAVALAGIMGGAESEVTASTTRLLLECAGFEPRRVRRGARALALTTEASKRFERGVDPEIGPVAAARFLDLLQEIVPGASLGRGRERVAARPEPARLALRASRLARLTGLRVPAPRAAERLLALEFGVSRRDAAGSGGATATDDEVLEVTVPSWRLDVAIEDDLVEEVARSIGYDQIPEVPLLNGGVFATRSPRERLVARAREAMLARGLSEAWCTTLVSEREAVETAALLGDGAETLVRLRNPMSRESEVLRPNPVAGLLRAAAHNLRQGATSIRWFEIGAGFRAAGADQLPDERLMIAAIVAGARYAHAHDAAAAAVDFDDAKGLWEAWLGQMRVDTPEWRTYSAIGWKPGASAEVAVGTSRWGWAGTLSQALLRGWEIETPIHLFVALLDSVREVSPSRSITLPGRFPPVRRDLAFFVPEHVSHDALERVLVGAAGERLDSIELFDVYAGPGTPQGMKSLAFALQLQHSERTMTESEIQAIQDRIVEAVAKECGGRLREK